MPRDEHVFVFDRYLLEEGKLNLTIRLLVEFKDMQRSEQFAQVYTPGGRVGGRKKGRKGGAKSRVCVCVCVCARARVSIPSAKEGINPKV
jgi:hypothetical protein